MFESHVHLFARAAQGGRRRLLGLLSAGLAIVVLACVAPPASASRVLLLGARGHAREYNDRFLVTPALTPPPTSITRGALLAGAARARHRRLTVPAALTQMLRSGAISSADSERYRSIYSAARAALHRLQGLRAAELGAVLANVDQITATRMLTPARLPAVFETLERNREWWTAGPIPTPGERVEFTGSQLVWEYYPGQGIELQVLATFGKADAMYTAGPANDSELSALLGEMIPLAVPRAGGLAWEYYFRFEGGVPPWTSAMSQATAIEALTRAYDASGERSYLDVAHSALALFTVAPPTGVAVPTALGTRYLQYSFAPGDAILNAFLQTLIGLYDYAKVSGDPLAAQLFAAGDREAQAEVPRYDTGAWSLYQPGQEDTLSYHELVTGFLTQLCTRTQAPVYCTTAQRFQSYLTTPPVLGQLTYRVRGGGGFDVDFTLSKYSHVGIVLMRATSTVFLTSGYFGYGTDGFAVPSLPPGTYGLRFAATDLAGNFNRISGQLVVVAPPRPHRRRRHPGSRR